MSKPSLSIIVISFNTREMTLECLRSVFKETRETGFELIVLDNASSDGSAGAIRTEFGDRIKLIASNQNLGFAAGNNRAAKDAHGDFLLLLNPDTVVLDGAIDRLMAFTKNCPGAGIWGGKTLFAGGTLNPASCWQRQTVWSLLSQALGLSSLFRKSSLFNPEGMGGWNREGIRQVDIVAGCFLLIRHDLWRELGGFGEMFFMYGEDADLCLRSKKLGAQPTVTSAAMIIHYGGASEKIMADKLIRLLKAKSLLIQLHFPFRSRWLGLRLLSFWPKSRYLAFRILSVMRGGAALEKCKIWGEVCSRKKEWDVKVA